MPNSAVLIREKIQNNSQESIEKEADICGTNVATEGVTFHCFESGLASDINPIACSTHIDQRELKASLLIPVKPLAHKAHSRENYLDLFMKSFLCVLLLGFLGGTMLPCFIGAQGKARTAQVKGNMRTIQIAAESYAVDSHGKYPATLKDLEPYLPGGSKTIGGTPGEWPRNPIQAQSTSCVLGGEVLVEAKRQSQTQATGYKPGQVTYAPLKNGHSYAITGTDLNGMDVPGLGGKVLVLSCQ